MCLQIIYQKEEMTIVLKLQELHNNYVFVITKYLSIIFLYYLPMKLFIYKNNLIYSKFSKYSIWTALYKGVGPTFFILSVSKMCERHTLVLCLLKKQTINYIYSVQSHSFIVWYSIKIHFSWEWFCFPWDRYLLEGDGSRGQPL